MVHKGHAVRIISVDEKGEGFVLDEALLKSILDKIPVDMKVSIVSVVGAFRTGKSFLLDLFLRYLIETEGKDVSHDIEPDQSWLTSGNAYHKGDSDIHNDSSSSSSASKLVLKGNMNTKSKSNDSSNGNSNTSNGFGWRSGKERCTTGIWMWSDHFIRVVPKDASSPNGEMEKVAVLLIDTQGMFDSSTGQMLTAAIFGLSTLISSYQIYNIDKRIQEDNLQHLALFTEYGRVVLNEERRTSAKVDWSMLDFEAELEALKNETANNKSARSRAPSGESIVSVAGIYTTRPFQRLEFLVRDWQDFDEEEEDGPMEELRKGMKSYLEQVLNERSQKDLKQVREQIRDCFETVSCFLLPHPGFEITKKTYDGDLSKLQPQFRRLLSEYVRLVFTARLVPKKVYGRPVTATELFQFIKIYATLFKEAKIFPEAKTLLAATSEANNRSAVDIGIRLYSSAMDAVAGKNKSYIDEDLLKDHHKNARKAAVMKFHSIAILGPKSEISQFKKQLEDDIAIKYAIYVEANKLRDPYSFVGPVVIPFLVAVFAYVARVVIDWTCFGMSDYCIVSSQFLQMLYTAIMAFGLFRFMVTGHGVRKRVYRMIEVFIKESLETKENHLHVNKKD